MLTVTTRAATLALTTLATARMELPDAPSGASEDAYLTALIRWASSAIHSYCNRDKAPFLRQAYSETLGGYGDTWLQLKATPLVVVNSVLQDGSVLTDWAIEDPDQGLLYRRSQFFATAQLNPGFTGRQYFPGFGAPIPGSEEPRFTVAYVAGWISTAQDLSAVAGVSAAAADNSFNSTGLFPALLQAGDVFTTSGFGNAANNGTFTVVGTPTASKVLVSATLGNESPATASLTFHTMPDDLEKAAVETVKAWYLDRQRSPHSKRERVGEQDLEWTDPAGIPTGLPVTAVGLLRSYMRAA